MCGWSRVCSACFCLPAVAFTAVLLLRILILSQSALLSLAWRCSVLLGAGTVIVLSRGSGILSGISCTRSVIRVSVVMNSAVWRKGSRHILLSSSVTVLSSTASRASQHSPRGLVVRYHDTTPPLSKEHARTSLGLIHAWWTSYHEGFGARDVAALLLKRRERCVGSTFGVIENSYYFIFWLHSFFFSQKYQHFSLKSFQLRQSSHASLLSSRICSS